MNDTYIYDGLNEVKARLKLKLGASVQDVRIINDYNHDYFLDEKSKNKAVFVFISLLTSPISRDAHNSRLNITVKPSLSIQVYSVIKQKNETNMKLANQIATQIKKHLNGFKTTNWGVLHLPVTGGNNTPMAVYSGESTHIGWGVEFPVEGLVKLDTGNITITSTT